MSLATRCTECGTVFRVVQDQLKVSEGWVRCGRCQSVFNALEGLFDLDREAPPEWHDQRIAQGELGASLSGRAPLDPAEMPQIPEPTRPVEAVQMMQAAGPAPDIELDLTLNESLNELGRGSLFDIPTEQATEVPTQALSSHFGDEEVYAARPVLSGNAESDDGFADARFNTALFNEDAQEPPPQDVDSEQPTEAFSPSFLRDAEQAAQWRKPRTRIALGLVALLLLGTLTLQAALHFHDRWAAAWPMVRGPLATLCDFAGCTIAPPRRLDALTVESSGLSPAKDNGKSSLDIPVDGGTGYRLSLVLHNRAPYEVATPSIDLSLTDSNGQLVSRRVLRPTDFDTPHVSLAATAETPLQVMLVADEAHIVGYSVEIFYP